MVNHRILILFIFGVKAISMNNLLGPLLKFYSIMIMIKSFQYMGMAEDCKEITYLIVLLLMETFLTQK